MRWAIPICTAAWIATALLCKAVPVREYKRVATASDRVTVHYSRVAFNRPPTDGEFAGRLAWSEPATIALTLAAIGAVRRASTCRISCVNPVKQSVCLAIATAIVGGWVFVQSNRGWTVGKLEQLIQTEIDPQWHEETVGKWVDSCCSKNGFKRGNGHAGIVISRRLLADGWAFLNWRLTPEEGANLGILKSGEIQVYFLFDQNSRRFVRYQIYAIEQGDCRIIAERHPRG